MPNPVADCPQCGTENHFRGSVATQCRNCETLLVRIADRVKRAEGFEGHLPADGETVALICRFCAGALSQEVLKGGSYARCEFCGERASLPPTVKSALRVMMRHPRALPPSLRALTLLWGGITAIFLATILLYALMPEPSLGLRGVTPLKVVSAEAEVIKLDARTPTVSVHPRGNAFPYLSLAVWESSAEGVKSTIPGEQLQLLVTAVREEDGARRSEWLMYADLEGKEPRLHDTFSFTAYGAGPLLPGHYHLEISEARLRGGNGALPKEVAYEWNTFRETLNLWFILMANVLIWSFVFDLKRWAKAGDPLKSHLHWRPVLMVALMAGLVYFTVTNADPGGQAGSFEEQAPPAPPGWEE